MFQKTRERIASTAGDLSGGMERLTAALVFFAGILTLTLMVFGMALAGKKAAHAV